MNMTEEFRVQCGVDDLKMSSDASFSFFIFVSFKVSIGLFDKSHYLVMDGRSFLVNSTFTLESMQNTIYL